MLEEFLLKTSSFPERLCYPISSISENSKNKQRGLTPSPVFARTIYKQPLNDFMIFFGLNSTAMVLGCVGVASVKGLLPPGPPVWFTNDCKTIFCVVLH